MHALWQLLGDLAHDLRVGEGPAWFAAVAVVIAGVWIGVLVLMFGGQ